MSSLCACFSKVAKTLPLALLLRLTLVAEDGAAALLKFTLPTAKSANLAAVGCMVGLITAVQGPCIKETPGCNIARSISVFHCIACQLGGCNFGRKFFANTLKTALVVMKLRVEDTNALC